MASINVKQSVISRRMSTSHDPDVAVIIVSYRSAELAIASIRSVEADCSRGTIGARVVVVDNASGDGPAISAAIAANGWSGWVTLIVSPRNGGFGYGNNLGIAHAFAAGTPKYVYLLNPDAQLRPGALEALARFFDSHPQAGIAGSGIDNADGSEWPIAFRFPGLLSEIDSSLGFGPVSRLLRRWAVARRMGKIPQQVDWVCGASMMIRPAVLEAIGGFDGLLGMQRVVEALAEERKVDRLRFDGRRFEIAQAEFEVREAVVFGETGSEFDHLRRVIHRDDLLRALGE